MAIFCRIARVKGNSLLECYPSDFTKKTLSEQCFLLLLRLPRSRPAYSARTWTWSFSTASVRSFLQGAYTVCRFPLKGRFDHQSWPLHEMCSLLPNECTDNGAIDADVVVHESIVIDTSKLKHLRFRRHYVGGKLWSNISNTRDSVSSGHPNTEKRVKNTTCSGVLF